MKEKINDLKKSAKERADLSAAKSKVNYMLKHSKEQYKQLQDKFIGLILEGANQKGFCWNVVLIPAKI